MDTTDTAHTSLTPDLPWVTIFALGYAAGTSPNRTRVLSGRPARVAHWLAGYRAALRGNADETLL